MRFSLAAFLTPILAAASLAQPNGRCRVRPSQDETVSPSSSTVGDNGASVTQPSQAGVVKPLSTFISTSLVIVQATSASRDSGYTRNGGGVAAALAGETTKSVGKTRTMTTKTTGTTLPSATSVSSSGKSAPPPASSSAGSGGGGGGSDPLGMVALHDSVRAQYGMTLRRSKSCAD